MKHFVNKLTFNAFIAVFIALFGFILIHSGQSVNCTTSISNPSSNLVFFWLFDTSLPNDTPLEAIDPIYNLNPNAILLYNSALSGYPFSPDHPNWRKASMERRNAPTPLNYRPEGNNGISYDVSNMRAIQVKQPFVGDGGENTLYFHLPTNGFKDIVFQFAAKNEGAADKLSIDYSVNSGEPVWTTTGLANPTPDLSDNYQLYVVNFSQINEASNNQHFKIRIRFIGENMSVDEGKRVTFNNFSIDASALSGNNLPPVIINNIELQELIEQGDGMEFNLNNIFSDPDNDPLVFSVVSERPTMVQATLTGSTTSITPLKRGDAIITITANDGFNPTVQTSFRVLVYPRAFPLKDGELSFTYWNYNEPEYSYPQYMMFLQSEQNDPKINDALLFPYFIPHDDYHPDDLANLGFPYKNSRRTRINGLDDDGIAFINTGRGRDLGGLLIAVDLSEVESAKLDWLGGTIIRNNRVYAIRLFYRTNLFTPFADLMHNGQEIEYVTAQQGDVKRFSDISLPDNIMNQKYVQFLWKYYLVEGDTSSRAQLRLDDIVFKNVTGINESQKAKFDIYTKDGEIILTSPTIVNGDIMVYDVMGRLIKTNKIRNSTTSVVDLGMIKGVFVVRLITSENNFLTKILLR